MDCKIFADFSAFRVMVKQLKNTGLIDPKCEDTTAL
jgi:hypothetical protein